MGNLPASRTETCINGAAVNPNLINEIQDVLIADHTNIRTTNLRLRGEHSISAGGTAGITLSGAGDALLAGLEIPVGATIVGFRARIQDSATGPTKLQLIFETFTGVTNTISTSTPSAGTGTVQTLTLSGLSVVVDELTSYYALVSFQTGTAACVIVAIVVDWLPPT